MAIVRQKRSTANKLIVDGEFTYTRAELGLAMVAECREATTRKIQAMAARPDVTRALAHDIADLYLQMMVLAELVERRIIKHGIEIAA